MLVDGPHFQATNEGELVFLLSDGDTSRRPGEHEIIELEEESGTVRQNYYLRIPLSHSDSHRWRAEIAKYLAPLVLGSTYNSLTYHNAHIRLSEPRLWPISGHLLTYLALPPSPRLKCTATTPCNAVKPPSQHT